MPWGLGVLATRPSGKSLGAVLVFKFHKLGGLKQQSYSFTTLGTRSQKSRWDLGRPASETCRAKPFFAPHMAPHSSTLAWKIPWMEEPGGLWSMGSLRAGQDWATSLSLFTFMHWRRKWQPTPVFWPGESQGRGNLVGCHLWGRTESDTTEVT